MKNIKYKVLCIKSFGQIFNIGMEYKVQEYDDSALLVTIGKQGIFFDKNTIDVYFKSIKDERLRKLNKLDEIL